MLPPRPPVSDPWGRGCIGGEATSSWRSVLEKGHESYYDIRTNIYARQFKRRILSSLPPRHHLVSTKSSASKLCEWIWLSLCLEILPILLSRFFIYILSLVLKAVTVH